MSTGIIICGLNGSGKSTLGKALAEELGYHFIDNEYLFFSRTKTNEPYTNPRTREEAEALFTDEVREHGNFVFASVTGDYAKDVRGLYQYAILLEVPKEIRIKRVIKRSFQKFGNRMMPGGDLYEKEEAFFQFVKERPEDHTEKWVETLVCPVLHVDGTKPVEENVVIIRKWIRKGKNVKSKNSN